ncbi:hypothetical protein LEM8419_02027 [Neolewinella maritima]|uniref:Uncharacterized protein n=1 Tax=Neolewinella maritima TaxID=1383882 RepID=A0ABM9B1D8_9BACT|nr:hypothetical protein [Neolewinella maritima]CAH1001072.1 hypothetical protein LEM8419_02027 [Neolewinella maritima]
MKTLLITFFLLLCTCVPAQEDSRTQQLESEDGTHYTYSLRTTTVDQADLVQAFAQAAGVTVNARFSGDWTTSDDDGIAYSLDTRRNRLSIDYRGDDAEVMQRAKEKARVLRKRLNIPVAPEPKKI